MGRSITGSRYWRLWSAGVWVGCDHWSHNYTRYLGRWIILRN